MLEVSLSWSDVEVRVRVRVRVSLEHAWLSWSDVIHHAPPMGGPTKSYCRKSSIRRVAAGHMIVSGWKTSTCNRR
jgi:hypothetical protein